MPALTGCVAAVALLIAGCGTTSSTNSQAVTVAGSTLSIYASQPSGDTGGQAAADVVDAERLAFGASGVKVGAYSLAFHVVQDREVSADARQVIADKTAIAYLGEVIPGTSGISLQITNQFGLLQVSPTDTATYLTRSVAQVKKSPRHFYPAHSTYGATFARVVPTTLDEAQALVKRMRTVGVKTLDVGDDGGEYGTSLAAEVRSDATAAGITVSSSPAGADAVFYAGEPTTATAHALDAAATAAPKAKLFAPSALYDDTFVAGLSGAAQKALTVSSPGLLKSELDPAGQQFQRTFQTKYGHAPAPAAIFGYEAMRAVLASLSQASSHAAVRQVVANDFRSLTRSANDSVLGAYRLSGGDTNFDHFVFATVTGGKLVPRAAG